MRLLPGSRHFHVVEVPAYAPGGAGEHLYVEIEKEGLNTDDVALALSRACGVKAMAVGFAGRKDRHAITRQWFSVLGGQEAQLAQLPTDLPKGRMTVLSASRHGNKLRVGHLRGNRFRLGLADVRDPQALLATLQALARTGIANRFGPQRFGLGGVNLRIARLWGGGDLAAAAALIVDPAGGWRAGLPLPTRFRLGPEGQVVGALKRGLAPEAALGRAGDLRKLIASAAQAAVFNAVLDARAASGLTHRLRAGDLASLANGAPFCVAEADLADVNARAEPGRLEVLATGPLPGTWRLAPGEAVQAEERAWSADAGMRWEWFQANGAFESPGGRRPLVVPFLEPPAVETADGITWASFALPAGAFATEVLGQCGIALPENRAG
jgi:tRNA pseudouridine13 synthase